jgi:hypothetical protein
MLKRISRMKNIEEVLGAIGLVFILALAGLAFVLINFLVFVAEDSLKPSATTKPAIVTFDFNNAPPL